ncbi:MAG: hypothetical protein QXT84_04185 [Candidatus Bathyarchaeia archaeon]
MKIYDYNERLECYRRLIAKFPNGQLASLFLDHISSLGILAVLGQDVYGNRFDHAFNSIRTVKGLVYVEPQNDGTLLRPNKQRHMVQPSRIRQDIC